jgi:hypothetical protein
MPFGGRRVELDHQSQLLYIWILQIEEQRFNELAREAIGKIFSL